MVPNIFIGMIKALLLIRLPLALLCRSDLFLVMNCGMATIYHRDGIVTLCGDIARRHPRPVRTSANRVHDESARRHLHGQGAGYSRSGNANAMDAIAWGASRGWDYC